ncbi:hypothetical protein [Winogradskyella sp. 3972H.M.0a.05]|uniref:hypothetical protein n=1 Tax=Winogradskyella sp. 3972H.M.0a.05 TaxID=2950277 RepID=UPI0033953B48
MKKFIVHISVFSLLVTVTILAVFSRADGHSDQFYLKLTGTQKSNLILGTSKAAQGIQPEILKKHLEVEPFNYAFAIYASKYGDVYLNSIKSKLDTTKSDQVFIVTVDPWSISSTSKNPNDIDTFRENKSFLNSVKEPSNSANYNYLINHFEGNYYNILSKSSPAFLHDDGWLEVNIDNDSTSVANRTLFTINDYKKNLKKYNYSSARLSYLMKTIEFLSTYGNVYLVRLPIHPELMDIENTYMPDFDSKISEAISSSKGYLDLTNDNSGYHYIDGAHLHKESGAKISLRIANWIKELPN